MWRLMGLILVAVLAGCSVPTLDQAVQDKAQEALALLEAEDRDPAALAALVESKASPEDEQNGARQVMSIFPHERIKERSVAGWQVYVMNGEGSYQIVYQYEFETSFVLVQVQLHRDSEVAPVKIVDLTTRQLTGSMREANRFTLWDKSLPHYAFALWAIAGPIFVLATVVVCLRSPIGRRKRWWWLICVIGVLPWGFNWTTGDVRFNVLSFPLFSFGFSRANDFSPVILQGYVPIGAVIFWIRRRKLIAREAERRTQATAAPPLAGSTASDPDASRG